MFTQQALKREIKVNGMMLIAFANNFVIMNITLQVSLSDPRQLLTKCNTGWVIKHRMVHRHFCLQVCFYTPKLIFFYFQTHKR